MIRLLVFFILVLVAALAGSFLLEQNGILVVEWLGYHIETSVAVAVLAAVFLFLLATLAVELLLWLVRMPRILSRKHALKKQQAGQHALIEGFTAIAAGDIANAKKLVYKAQQCHGLQPSTRLLFAQIAQAEGDRTASATHFAAMLEYKETESAALKGLLTQAQEEGDTERALSLAERLHVKQPKATWILPVLVELYCKVSQWDKARHTLQKAIRHKMVSKERAARTLAIMEFMQAETAYKQKNLLLALQFARAVHKRLPDFIPATLLIVKIYRYQGKLRKAESVVFKSWSYMPHPALAEAYAGLYEKELPEKREKRFEKLLEQAPHHPESHAQLAKVALAAGHLNKARTHTKAALHITETASLCRLMAQIEERERQEKEAHHWLERASYAAQDAAWNCTRCHTKASDWHILCGECHGFDTIRWESAHTLVTVDVA